MAACIAPMEKQGNSGVSLARQELRQENWQIPTTESVAMSVFYCIFT